MTISLIERYKRITGQTYEFPVDRHLVFTGNVDVERNQWGDRNPCVVCGKYGFGMHIDRVLCMEHWVSAEEREQARICSRCGIEGEMLDHDEDGAFFTCYECHSSWHTSI